MSTTIPNGLVRLDKYALIIVKGPDAFKFLQGQVTCDVQALKINESMDSSPQVKLSISALGAHCTHKGRMLFSFRACALNEETVALRVHKSLLSSAIAALKKYSVFSKVDISDASDAFQLFGGIGDHTQLLPHLQTTQATLTANMASHDNAGNLAIAVDQNRLEYWMTNEHLSTLEILNQQACFIDSDNWTFCDIQSGLGEVQAETIELFIPQMLNYQVVGNGISFTKGCYTGQEVVARMQYLGKLKRRMHRFKTESKEPLVPGMPLYSPSTASPVGNIVIHAGDELLAVVTESTVAEEGIYLDPTHQQKLHALPLPYAITKE